MGGDGARLVARYELWQLFCELLVERHIAIGPIAEVPDDAFFSVCLLNTHPAAPADRAPNADRDKK